MGKKVHNRYDYYEIMSVFSESTDDYMLKKHSPVRRNFYVKCVLGPLLALNAYLSHWGPMKWPHNETFLIFSIVFYYAVTYIYNSLDAVKNSDGAMVTFVIIKIGEYVINPDENRKYLMNVSEDRLEYTLEEADSKGGSVLRKKAFLYTDYFTEAGEFLEDAYQKNLGGFLKNAKVLKTD